MLETLDLDDINRKTFYGLLLGSEECETLLHVRSMKIQFALLQWLARTCNIIIISQTNPFTHTTN